MIRMEKKNGKKMIKIFDNYIKESVLFELSIGSRVGCLDGIQDNKQVGGLTGKIIGISHNGGGYLDGAHKRDLMYHISFDKNDINLRDYYVFHDLVVPLEGEYLKKLSHAREEYRKKKEESRLKHIEIDPYGEEEWEK